ncbi:GGDEF domain-containing protein [Colwellia sp. BRX10-6]|uniref:tetratricopeptide repeat-containing diguanylate cyclase n=1 Tax=unclassified Colwellia TaxID=196834 RepID=UPI0015F68DFF|nr:MULTISPECIES: diguanylate cyclase [unclassified Colwellia]MBA6383145.1 GGDEF domain-containing protein [Colwellia sp. BRX10-9]MBA6395741.1 GGDEF domain-containing protein [Colwellia sp. BRX10-6]
MIKWLIALILSLIITSPSLANEVNVDSLKATLTALPLDDKARLAPLIELASYYLYIAPKETSAYATQALAFTSIEDSDFNKAKLLRLLGQSQMYQGLNLEAFKHLTQAINSANKSENVHLISVSNRAMGVFHELIIDHKNAVKYYIEALKFAKLSDQKEDLAMVYNNLGNVLNSQNDYTNAVKYFKKSIVINTELNDIAMQMNASVGLSVSYLRSDNPLKAQQLLEEVLRNKDYINDFSFSEASANLADVYKYLKNFTAAESLYKFVINDEKGSIYPPAVASAYLGLADIYIQTNQIKAAIDLYHKGIVEVKNKISVESEMALYENLAKLELSQENFKAAAIIQTEYINRRNQVQPLTQKGLLQKLESQLLLERDYIKLQDELLISERESRHASMYLFAVIVISLISLVLFLVLMLRKQVISRLEATNKTLKKASETDHLTSIGNRRFLEHQIDTFRGRDIQMAFLLLDVDYFKDINDNFGHDAGDEVLVAIADKIKRLCRKDDLFARIGGEEFVILLMNSNEVSACLFAERVRSSIEKMALPFQSKVTASIGVTFGNMNNANYDELYKQADIALYSAKDKGRNKVLLFPSLDPTVAD